MERLRHVARAAGAPQRALVSETADALLDVVDDHGGLVTACRQMVHRQPTSAALVWLAANLLAVDEPHEVVWDLVRDIDHDPTGREVAHVLAPRARVVTLGWGEVVTEALARRGDVELCVLDGPVLASRIPDFEIEPTEAPLAGAATALTHADVVVCEALAAGPSAVLVPAGALGLFTAARYANVPVWAVVPRGRALPEPLWKGLVRRLPTPSVHDDHEVVDGALVDRAISPVGVSSLVDAVHAGCCPSAPELQ